MEKKGVDDEGARVLCARAHDSCYAQLQTQERLRLVQQLLNTPSLLRTKSAQQRAEQFKTTPAP